MINIRLKNSEYLKHIRMFFKSIGYKSISDTKYTISNKINNKRIFFSIGVKSYQPVFHQEIEVYYD